MVVALLNLTWCVIVTELNYGWLVGIFGQKIPSSKADITTNPNLSRLKIKSFVYYKNKGYLK